MKWGYVLVKARGLVPDSWAGKTRFLCTRLARKASLTISCDDNGEASGLLAFIEVQLFHCVNR